ncbi:leucyl aminopeptidase [Planctomyces sp. SH-PL62]|uniref:leucyl aminopeptidase n=1 Tax=Planctomyces sp. SH-PL62 TaxID=1636152 RepID=UPI00078CD977|nr:leucyl aminopeptidase [Planctomyces sp. SH-PL62]AMV38533.1 Cytosol aminopeptidase [Planctomyces sp. SH-PL62]
MTISIIRQPLATVDAPWVAAGIFDKDGGPASDLRGSAVEALVVRLLEEKEIKGSAGETIALHEPVGFRTRALLLAGLGAKARFDARAAYTAGVALAKRLASKPREKVGVSLAAVLEAGDPALVSSLVEGVCVGMQGPGLHKTEPNRHPFEVVLIAPEGTTDEALADLERLAARGGIVGQAVNLARMLANTPPSEKPPVVLAEVIRKAAEEHGVDVQVWNEARIREERFGGLLGVAAGSAEPPAFVTLEYLNGGDAPVVALVGKGVTFDSGGLSLKPSASMEDMKSDMTGAAVVVASILAAARLRLPINVKGYVALTENMTGGRAMKLGDVLTMRNGKTVEVLNTDAEGRLILADALSYAAEAGPARMLDLATLTGACLVALGPKIAGLFSNDDGFARDLADSSRKVGERLWQMPLDDDFKEALKSSVADLKNVGGRWGGAITAARFLQEFTADVPWAHLDIAGPSWVDAEGAARDAGGTGCFVRTLTAYLEAAAAVDGVARD